VKTGNQKSLQPKDCGYVSKPKNVLVLFPGAPGQPMYDMMFSEIRTTIQMGYGGPLNLYVEYLERVK
jgi:hypothetical protein